MNGRSAELQRFRRDTEYFEAHREEFLRRYPESWLAILNQKVVAVAPDFERLLNELEVKGVPVGRVLTEHVTAKDDLLILGA